MLCQSTPEQGKGIYPYLARVENVHTPESDHTARDKRLYAIVLGLSIFTIVYNLAEGIVATWFGYQDESVTLFGFGVDSFIELISGVGIAHMVIRMQLEPTANRDKFERLALRITGVAFYLLGIGLVVSAVYNIWSGHKPVTTLWGVIISSISILVMLFLIYGKTVAGRKLKSEAILADAQCTKVCIYMSVILLVSSGIFAWTGITWIDAAGTLGLAWFSYREGKECFEKAASDSFCSCDHHK
jgi:divalent metal cation (Fe/Co/Zn/Cd) transporter